MEHNITQLKSNFNNIGKTLIVFFSGKQPNYNNNYFHFWGFAESLKIPYICVRDTSNVWYNTKDYNNFVNVLKQEIIKSKCSNIIFSGSSMGGYGALKYGLDIPTNKIIVFSTQVSTPFGPNLADLYSTRLDHAQISAHLCKSSINPRWDDIGAAAELKKKANAEVIIHDCNNHNCAELVMKAGKLHKIFQDEIK